MKKCKNKDCQIPVEEQVFGNSKVTPDGLEIWCKACIKERNRLRYEKNGEKIKSKIKAKRIEKSTGTITCPYCPMKSETYEGAMSHFNHTHPDQNKENYRWFIYTGSMEVPLCACGCGEEMDNPQRYHTSGVRFKQGHYIRVEENNPHTFRTKETFKQSGKTWSEQFVSGEREGWNKGLTKETDERVRIGAEKMNTTERAAKISEALKGVPKSEEHAAKATAHMKEYWGDQIHREEQGVRRGEYYKTAGFIGTSKAEQDFRDMLLAKGLKIEWQFRPANFNGIFDFLLIGHKVIIEFDGDHFHCRPGTIHEIPVYAYQHRNIEKDRMKNEWCQENGYTIIRVWWSDFKKDPVETVKTVIRTISCARQRFEFL